MISPVRSSRIRLSLALFLAFGVVGGSACLAILQMGANPSRASFDQNTLALSRLAARQIGPEPQLNFRNKAQLEDPAYKQQCEKLAALKALAPAIHSIYTLTRTDGQIVYAIDPAPAGDHNGNGIDQKHLPGQPVVGSLTAVDQAWKSGETKIEDARGTDGAVELVRSYAPITNQAGEVVALLVIEQDAGPLFAQVANAHQTALSAFCLVLFLAGVASVVASSKIYQSRSGDSAARHLADYRQISENLTIGIFKYSAGAIVETNAEWDRQMARLPGERPEDTLARRLDPTDRELLFSLFERTLSEGAPFEARYRVCGPEGDRFFETHGLPVVGPEGAVSHMIGFALDSTSAVRIRKELEQKNAEVEAKNELMQKAITDLQDNFEATVHSLVKAVEAKDPYTAGHSERVMGYSMRIGLEMKLKPKELRILEMGALIHDIGKIGVPDVVLTKKGKLTDLEFHVIKEHPRIGAKMVQGIPLFSDCVPIILSHHERLDGSGYPHGIAGTELSTLVRICAVADCFDAMTSTRAYRAAMSPETAMGNLRIEAKAGTLDGEIVEILADIVQRDGILWMPMEERVA